MKTSGNKLDTDCRFKRPSENQAAEFMSWRLNPGYRMIEIWCTDTTK